MTAAESRRALDEAERAVAELQAKGWALEALETCDERNEDFRVVITLTHPGFDIETKGVM